MRVPIAIIAGATLIALSILVVGRYTVGHVAVGTRAAMVIGVDEWTGEPFMRQAPRNPPDFRQYGMPVN